MDDITIKKEIRTAFKKDDSQRIIDLIGDNKHIINMKTAFGSWLHVAADFGNFEVVKFLVNKGIDIEIDGGPSECTAIKTASSEGYINIVRYLFEHGAKLDTSEAYKNPIFGAIYGGHLDIVKYLVEAGIDISLRYKGENINNMNAIEYAKEYGQTEIAEYLLSTIK